MNQRLILSTILAVTLGSWGLASAQGFGGPNERGRNDRNRNDQGPRAEQQDRRDNEARSNNRWVPPGQAKKMARQDEREERGAGPNHDFRRGSRLPQQYRSYQYVVNDWQGHRLSAPPRGYHWVQTGGDYVLIAIATGIIAQLILGN